MFIMYLLYCYCYLLLLVCYRWSLFMFSISCLNLGKTYNQLFGIMGFGFIFFII